jgi:hypothetical protein
VPPEGVGWALENAIEALDSWAQRETPSQDLRLIVADWVMTRHEDPYRGMQRQQGFANLWTGPIRETTWRGRVVTCTCMIFESRRTVRFDTFTTLSLPL